MDLASKPYLEWHFFNPLGPRRETEPRITDVVSNSTNYKSFDVTMTYYDVIYDDILLILFVEWCLTNVLPKSLTSIIVFDISLVVITNNDNAIMKSN